MKTILDLNSIELEIGIWKTIDTLILKRNSDNSIEILGGIQELKIVCRQHNLTLRMRECENVVIVGAKNIRIDNIRCNNMEIKNAKIVRFGLVQCNNLIITAESVFLSGNIVNANINSINVKIRGLCSNSISINEKLATNIELAGISTINMVHAYAKHIKLLTYDDNTLNTIGHIRLNAENIICIDIAKDNILDSKLIIEAIAPEIKLLGYNTNAELVCNGKLITDNVYKIKDNELRIRKAVPLSFIKERFNSIVIEDLARLILDKEETIYINELEIMSKIYKNRGSKIISLTNKDILVVNEVIKLSNQTVIDDSVVNICVIYDTLGYAVRRTLNRKRAVIGIPDDIVRKESKLAMFGKREYMYILDTLSGKRNDLTYLGTLVRKGITIVNGRREETEIELNYTDAKIVDLFRQFKQSDRLTYSWVEHKEGIFMVSKNSYGKIVGTYGNTILFSVDIGKELVFTGLYRNTKAVLDKADIFSRVKYIKKVLDYKIMDMEGIIEYGNAFEIIRLIESILRYNNIVSIIIPDKQLLFILTTRGWVGYDINIDMYANTVLLKGDIKRIDNLEERIREEYGV